MDYFAEYEKDGFTIRVRLEPDDDSTPPWERADGHGPVSEWTNRKKEPGERVLIKDYRSDSARYYDVAAATRIAKTDGWDAPPYGTGTNGQKAARAVEADFQFLRGWCRDDWHYVGVVLSVYRNGILLDDHAASVWGVEDNATDYLKQLAEEMVDEAVAAGQSVMAKLNEGVE